MPASNFGFTFRLSRKLSVIFLCALAASDGQSKKSMAPAVSAPAQQAAAVPKPPSYERELEGLTAGIERGIRLSAEQPNDGLLPLEIVSVYLDRARLTGNYDDYKRAESLLEQERNRPSKPGNACLAHAKLHYTLHRLKRASAALGECPGTVEKIEIAALWADIAFYSGRYKEAEATYRALVNQVGLPAHFIRLAQLRNKMGAPGEAAAFLEAAEKRYHGGSAPMQAWLKLQRGLISLDRGRLDEALALYRLAEDALPGWWLIEEHIAEVKALTGDARDARDARTLYENVIRKTQAPEYLDALAKIELKEGRAEAAQKLTAQARALYEERLTAFPEAAAGHALDHFLQDAANPQRALALAQKNFETRPYGDAAIALAKAWLLNGKPNLALPVLEAQRTNGWDTAELYWTLTETVERLADSRRAAQLKQEALRRNPQSAKMYAVPAIGN